MEDTQNVEGSSSPEPIENESADSNESIESNDGWSDAEEAFETVESEPQVEVADPKVEAPSALDLLHVPHKYKSKVKEFLDAQLKEKSSEFEKQSKEFEPTRQAAAGVLNALKEVAANPEKLADFISEKGLELGVDPVIVEQYRNYKYGNKNNVVQNEQQSPQDLFEKYKTKLGSADSPESYLRVMEEYSSERESRVLGVVKQLLGGYHEKIVNPYLTKAQQKEQEYQKVEAENSHKQRVSTWDAAINAVGEKYKEWGDFDSQKVGEAIANNPLVAYLNSNPEAAKKAGITHESLMEQAYLSLTHESHVNKRKAVSSGLKPTGKFVTTKKHQADGWDDIGSDIYGIRPE
jgi:hypothetical protein